MLPRSSDTRFSRAFVTSIADTGDPAPAPLDNASQWRTARRLYSLYMPLVKVFGIGAPCLELESPINRSEPEVLARVQYWFDEMDSRIQVQQWRQLAQVSDLFNEENLRDVIQRHLKPAKATPANRDKVDFLMAQYFAHRLPAEMERQDLTLEQVARALEPVLGRVVTPPRWLLDLEETTYAARRCRNLRELLDEQIVEKGRTAKAAAGEGYYRPDALIAFARFNVFTRHAFVRHAEAELEAVHQALRALASSHVERIDGSRFGFSPEEPVARLRQLHDQWRKAPRGAYTRDDLRQLTQMRAAVEEAVSRSCPQLASEPPAPAPSEDQAPSAPPDTGSFSKLFDSPAQRHAFEEWYLGSRIKEIGEMVRTTGHADALAPLHLEFGELKLVLRACEAAAFAHPESPFAAALQRGVAMRSVLLDAVNRYRATSDAADLVSALKLAHSDAARMQESIAEAGDAGNIDAVLNLAASAKQLLVLIEQADETLDTGLGFWN